MAFVRKEDDPEAIWCQAVGVWFPRAGLQVKCHSTQRTQIGTRSLTEGFGVEGSEVIIFYGKADLNWFAAYLAVFDVGLTTHG
jgi:hypothetical protein